MNALVESIKANDGRNRTYNLVEHTADAVRLNERGCKIRLRRYLKLIDRASWNQEEFSTNSGNRLMRRFAEWCNSDDEKIAKERKETRNLMSKHRGGWKPYLCFDYKTDNFLLTLPARLVRGVEAPDVYWTVRYGDREAQVPVSVEAAVTGSVTKETSIELTNQEVFGAFDVSFSSNGEQQAKWKIPADPIRFFETNGDHVEPKALRPGDAVSFSDRSYVPSSEAIYYQETWGGLLRCSFQFEEGDLIVFPDKKALSIGKRPAEGMLKRGLITGAYGEKEDKRYPVYSSLPSLFARILPESVNGTQLRVNGQNYRLFDNGAPLDGVIAFDLQERVPEEGVHIALGQFGVNKNGLYHVELDIPKDYAKRTWDFMLINGLEYSFDEAPYIFVENGVLCVPAKTGLKKHDEIIREAVEDGQLRFAFAIPEEDECFRLELDGVPVAFEIPKLSYRFPGDESWQTKLLLSIWHKELPDIVEVRFPADRITILLDEEGNYIIPVLSGHIGGAVQLSKTIASLTGGNEVITTASDRRGAFAIDTWAHNRGLVILNPEKIVDVTSAVLEGRQVRLSSTIPLSGNLPVELDPGYADKNADIVLSPYVSNSGNALLLSPCISVGIGTKKGVTKRQIALAVAGFCKEYGFLRGAIRTLFTIDLKKNEEGLNEFCREEGFGLVFYSADKLSRAPGEFTASDFVKEVTGVDNVCERAAILGEGPGGVLAAKKTSYGGITLAAAIPGRMEF